MCNINGSIEVRLVDFLNKFDFMPKVPIEAARILFNLNNWKKKSATEVFPLVPVTATIWKGFYL